MVEWKKLGEVCQVLNGFAFKSSEYVTEGIRIIRISDVQNGYISDKDRVYYPIEKLSEYKRYLLNNGDLVMSLTGNPGRVAFIRKESCALNQRVACLIAKTISNSYLFYLFNCKEFESTAFANSTGGAQKNLSTTWLNNFPIPIPSLEEQTRIVGILDTFTSAIDNLKEQIAQRRKQYEYYRDQLLDLEGKEGVEMKTLGEACEIRRGIRVVKKQLKDNALYPVFQNSIAPMGYYDQFNRDGNIPYIICAGSSSGSVGFCCTPFWAADDCYTIESSKVNRRYTYYALKKNNNYLFKLVRKGSMPRLPHEAIDNMIIPIPSLSEQQRIVSILDTFEVSIQNLEAQLKERQKQYEYYRNKLLTFD